MHATGTYHTVKRCRPFARRLLMTLRPCGVDILFKNPWVRFLRRLLGRNVMDIENSLKAY